MEHQRRGSDSDSVVQRVDSPLSSESDSAADAPTYESARGRFFDAADVCPELALLLENYDVLREEMLAATGWQDWPEYNLYQQVDGQEWKVFPFVHTFPSNDPSKTTWIRPNCDQCPHTERVLRAIPGARTALYSRMGPATTLTYHQGWADLANHVIRCHVPLLLPSAGTSGVAVEGEERLHAERELLLFDDSRMHMGFNRDPERARCVLIVDVARPAHLPRGRATGATTAALQAYIDYFRRGGDAPRLRGEGDGDEKLDFSQLRL